MNKKVTELPKRNYNIFAAQGDTETTDMDVVETLGLDPQVAYTPNINLAAAKKMEEENIKGYMAQGLPEAQARSLAKEHYNAMMATLQELGLEVKL